MEMQAKELAKYFKQKSEYNRLLKGIKNKYISYGEIKGNVTINNPDKLERRALSGLMKKDYSKNKTISVNLKTLQERIDNSKFAGAKIIDVIYEYYEQEIITNKQGKKTYEEEKNHFFEEILNQNMGTKAYKYVEEIIKDKNTIYQSWKKYYNKNKEELREALLNVCKAINNLPKEKTRIPVFASNITGNPHGFDKNNLCGKIFIMLICYMQNTKITQNAEKLSEIYYKYNLLIDDASNMVLCKNIKGYIKCFETNEIIQHLGLQGFAQNNEPIYLNLYNLSNIEFLSKSNKYDKVFVMENPAVFMEVSERCNKKDFPLVCTYGQVKLSALILLDMLVEQKYKIFYSGDIDPEGIQIADKLKNRYNENLCFFGFDINTYKKNLSNMRVTSSRLKKLDKIKSEDLREVCNELKLTQKVSFEEENINSIIDFIDENCI